MQQWWLNKSTAWGGVRLGSIIEKTRFPLTIMNNRLPERVSDFLNAVARREEALMQSENSFMRDAT